MILMDNFELVFIETQQKSNHDIYHSQNCLFWENWENFATNNIVKKGWVEKIIIINFNSQVCKHSITVVAFIK